MKQDFFILVNKIIKILILYYNALPTNLNIILGNGQNDHMSCFCCSQIIKDWEDDDEPWTTHAKWSPTCSYLLLSKGKLFINGADALKSGTIDLEASIHNFVFKIKLKSNFVINL